MTIADDKTKVEPDPDGKDGSTDAGLGDYSSDQSLPFDIGETARFGVTVFRRMPDVRHYVTEVLRQAGIIILSSSLIIWFMMGMLAAEISLEAHYLLRQLGAGGYAGIFTAVSDYTVAPNMWGWILSAKVGCGLVAEIGSMRISEEIDALEVMGLDSRAYLVSTRVLAMIIVTPFMFITGTGLMYMVNYVLNVHIFQSVSAGGYLDVFLAFLTSMDVVYSLTAGAIMGLIIVLVGCYYGYTAKGGPVGVGKNTAKSMVLNMIVVGVLGFIFQQLFFGGMGRAPIGN